MNQSRNRIKRDKEYVSPFKYVYKYISVNPYDKRIVWHAVMRFGGISTSKIYSTEREAAKAVDIFRINHGLEPINILKPQQ